MTSSTSFILTYDAGGTRNELLAFFFPHKVFWLPLKQDTVIINAKTGHHNMSQQALHEMVGHTAQGIKCTAKECTKRKEELRTTEKAV